MDHARSGMKADSEPSPVEEGAKEWSTVDGEEVDGEIEEWRCLAESNGVENPLCEKCRSLMCFSGLRQAATDEGFLHTSLIDPPPRDLELIACPLCKWCYSLLWNSPVKITIHKYGDSGTLTVQVYDMIRDTLSDRRICILADQEERIPMDYGIRPLVRNIGGEIAFSAVKDFLGRCVQSHQKCCAGVEDPPFLPKRVLDVSPPNCGEERSCRLYESKEGERAEYVSLSYCWGTAPHTLKLSKNNLPKLRDGIQVDRLGNCVQDAIKAVRMLGIRFLWVDALCIIQSGDEEDKVAEIRKMMGIYKNATLVLVAASLHGSDESFLRSREHSQRKDLCCFPALVKGKPVSMSVCPLSTYNRKRRAQPHIDVEHPISQRAWTLQECALARRLLVYSEHEVFWHCQETLRKQIHPSYIESPDSSLTLFDTNIAFQYFRVKAKLPPAWLCEWFSLVEDYTKRQMSYRADSLNALEGVAREVEVVTGQRYVFGSWDGYLLECLLWHGRGTEFTRWPQDSVDKEIPVAPSWSWASYSYPVSTMSFCHDFVGLANIIKAPEYPSAPAAWALQLCGRICPEEKAGKRGIDITFPDINYQDFQKVPRFRFYLGYTRSLPSNYRYYGGMKGFEIHEVFLVLRRIEGDRFKRIGLRHEGFSGGLRGFSLDWVEQTIWVE